MVRTILGISPGTRTTGIAVIRNGELIDFRVLTFKKRWSGEKRDRIHSYIKSFLDSYQTTDIAIKKLDEVRSSERLNSVTNQLLKVANENAIQVHDYSIITVKLGFGIARVNNKGLMDYIANLHPELRKMYLKEINSNDPYYIKAFEAIALATWCARDNEL